jgi:ribosome maturation factor RimP
VADELVKIREVLDPILEALGLDLWDLEFRPHGPARLLRVFIDRVNGAAVTVEDCAAVSRELGVALDVEDFIIHAYTLEVSSPGLDRALTRPEHFIRFAGKAVRVKTGRPIEGQKVFRGRLVGFADDAIGLELETGAVLNIALRDVAQASLEVEWPRKDNHGGK